MSIWILTNANLRIDCTWSEATAHKMYGNFWMLTKHLYRLRVQNDSATVNAHSYVEFLKRWVKIEKEQFVSLESNWNTAILWINRITMGKTITWNAVKSSALWPTLRYCLNWTISTMTLSILYEPWPLCCLYLSCRLFHPRNRNTSALSSGILVNVDGISLDRIDQLALQLIWNSLVSNQMIIFNFFSLQKWAS